MSIAAHHNDWLSLVEVSGPFLALPVLVDAFPGGLDKPDRSLTADLWHAYAEWTDDGHGGAADPMVHRAWGRFVVERALGYDADVLVVDPEELGDWTVEVPEHDATLRPDMVVCDLDADGSPLLLVQVVAPDVAVTQAPGDGTWSASPAERMETLLDSTSTRLGLVTNGEQWTLVHVAEGENTGFASWYASLWREEPLTLRAFLTLLGMRRFFAVSESETLLALLDRSREDQQGVTTQLGKQVRRAIEILIQQIDRVDHDRDRRLLEGMTEQRLYESAVTVMMRLIFLFYAEENDLLLLGDEFYDETYAASTLREQLQAIADENGEEILERFHDAWPRLLSTFRAVYAGVEHEQMRLPAYGGALFDPDRYPFLEGREPDTSWQDEPADPLPIDNRTVLRLLNAIQTLEVKVPGGGRESRPLSFRALDVEQIGHVYETLLDHTAVRADDWIFGLEGTKDKEPEIPLRELEARAADTKELVKYLKDETGRSPGALKNRIAAEEKAVYDRWGHRWKPAFGGDGEAAAAATKWGLLVREDSAEFPVVVPPGHVYVTESEQRRSSGTHYTPKSLTEEIVTHTLEPLVYEGPGEGPERSEWRLRTPNEILDLKVCDPACGSGAFLVQACRYLAERLVESWAEHATSEGPDGHALPAAAEERLVIARRYVADRCLYGVDINPLATEMAKLSLWLITLQKDRPFTFLDHAIRTGDSLLGVTDFETLESFGVSNGQTQLWSQSWAPQLIAAREAREELRSFSVVDAKDANHKRVLLDAAGAELADLRLVADAIAGVQLASSVLKRGEAESLRREMGALLEKGLGQGLSSAIQETSDRSRQLLDVDLPPNDQARNPFHWVLEFPEAFGGARTGFDAFVGNPPFVGGKRISGSMGSAYREYLVEAIAGGSRGNADYVAFFFLRSFARLRVGGCLGFVATNTVAQGDTRDIGLSQLCARDATIYRATRSTPWPGGASLEVAHVWLRRGHWLAQPILEGSEVRAIGSSLRLAGQVDHDPQPIDDERVPAFLGCVVNGRGFILTAKQARSLLEADQAHASVIRPYMGGRELNSSVSLVADRWVIDFRGMPLETAADYPDVLDIVEQEVRSVRAQNAKERLRREWWRYEYEAEDLYSRIAESDLVIAMALVSSTAKPALVPADQVFSNKVAVWPSRDMALLGLLSSAVHEAWAIRFGSTLRSDLNYSPTDVYATWPFPQGQTSAVADAMAELDAARRQLMAEQSLGLTALYNRFHAEGDVNPAIATVRDLSMQLEEAVWSSYGWDDLRPTFMRRETALGTRFTVLESELVEALDRLLLLNAEQGSSDAG